MSTQPKPLSPAELVEISERATKATIGPWEPIWESCDCGGDYPCSHGSYIHALHLPEARENYRPDHSYAYDYSEVCEFTTETMQFIAAARTDVPALLSHIAYLEGEARKAVSHARLYAYDLSTRATEQSGLGNRALADKLFNDSERVSADGETLFAALGQTHQEGIEK
jgi:hypothetical protein